MNHLSMLLRLALCLVLACCPVPGVAAGKAELHACGVLHWGRNATIAHGEEAGIPSFVYQTPFTGKADALLERFLLYFHPPMMTTAPLTLGASVGLCTGRFVSNYPLAVKEKFCDNGQRCVWKEFTIGELAEGLETSNSRWMSMRANVSAATTKFLKEGPPGSKPGDVGTTEGEIFLFAQGRFTAQPPFHVTSEGDHVTVAFSPVSTAPITIPASWLVMGNAEDMTFQSLGNLSSAADGRSSVTVSAQGVSRPVPSSTLLFELQEALVGEGLIPDEAMSLLAASRDHLLSDKSSKRYLLFIIPKSLADSYVPVELTGEVQYKVCLMVGRVDL